MLWSPDKMILLSLVWTLLTVPIWPTGSNQILLKDPVKVLYPKISTTETVDCDCGKMACDSVYWFRVIPHLNKIEFVGKHNNADRVFHGTVDQTRLKFTKRTSTAFLLSITKVTEADAGIYSCILMDTRKKEERFVPGAQLRPGETPPTVAPPPTTKTKVKHPVCRCTEKSRPRDEACDPQILWPLVGGVAGLGLGLVCTLFYFSRLPRKCYHHFQKH